MTIKMYLAMILYNAIEALKKAGRSIKSKLNFFDDLGMAVQFSKEDLEEIEKQMAKEDKKVIDFTKHKKPKDDLLN